ncbi:hypothetical protein [Tranquillimonas rosea]|nr:hypothetical protein [Tranquillimonas rosea]
MLMIATPSLLTPWMGEDSAQVVALVGIAAAILTVSEYASSYPCLYEFRDAPPFNRIRFTSLFVTVFLISVMCRGMVSPSSLTQFVQAIGGLVGAGIDFPYSPVRLVILMLPPDADVSYLLLVRASAGIAYLISLISMIVFFIAIRVGAWPLRGGSFNVWVNLPTFDPTAGGDIVDRLHRDGRINIALGFLLPFLMPAAIRGASAMFGEMSFETPQTMVWTVAAWAFLPTSLFMRGIAMTRIARMIATLRKRSETESAGLVTA